MALTRVVASGIDTGGNYAFENINVAGVVTATSFVGDISQATGAAVESFRNEIVSANYQNQELYKEALKKQIIPAQITPLNTPINLLQGEETP